MHRKTIALTLLCASFALSTAAHSNDAAPTEAATSRSPAALVITGGCMGGAVIGTVVPLFGNLVGCAVGGLTAWWFHES